VRADATAESGTGHIFRCLTLACALRDRGWRVVFIARPLADGLVGLLRGEGMGLVPLAASEGPPEGPADAQAVKACIAENCG